MTISNQTRSVEYTGNGATTEWPFAFPASAATLAVQLYDTVTEELEDIDPGDYSVVFDTSETYSAGTVTYPLVGAIAATKKLIITRTVPHTQTLALTNLQSFYPAAVMAALDFIVMQIQQVAERANRSLAVRAGEQPIDELVTSPAARASKALLFSDDGLRIEAGPTADDIEDAQAAATSAATSAAEALVHETAAEDAKEDIETLLAAGMASLISFAATAAIIADDVQEAIEAVQANLEALGGAMATGIIAKTAAGTFAARTIDGTANQITVTNPGGVAGNPVLALSVASQAEAEAGADTTKPMVALRTKQAIDAQVPVRVKAYVVFVGTTAAILRSNNVASVVRNATGVYTITFTTAMANANYPWTGTCKTDNTSVNTRGDVFQARGQTKTTAALQVTTATGSSATNATDVDEVCIIVYE